MSDAGSPDPLLVLVAFPVSHLAVEKVRTPVRNAVRSRRGKPLT